MAYTKNSWTDGDIVTSAKLNHMEDGIANSDSVMVINLNNGTLDKTWQEVYDAMIAGKLCVVRDDSGTPEGGISVSIVYSVFINEGVYAVVASDTYNTSSATGYPMIENGDDPI